VIVGKDIVVITVRQLTHVLLVQEVWNVKMVEQLTKTVRVATANVLKDMLERIARTESSVQQDLIIRNVKMEVK
jgi:hypothetical protein